MWMESEELRRSGYSVGVREPLSSGGQAPVYRVWPDGVGNPAVIVKLTDRLACVAREAAISDWLQQHPVVHSPRVLTSSDCEPQGFVVYEDLFLTDVDWTVETDLEIARLAAALHKGVDTTASVWREGHSHTPSASVIWQEVAASSQRALASSVRATGLSEQAVAIVLHVHRLLGEMEPQWPVWGLVGCHGDLHRGNVLARAGAANAASSFYVIDWEYAHVDSPFFDLFQWLDATSPTQSLKRLCARADAIAAYYHARFGAGDLTGVPGTKRDCLFAYLQFAAVHLLWIVLLVGRDVQAERFAPRPLRRQQVETVRGLAGIARMLRTLGVTESA